MVDCQSVGDDIPTLQRNSNEREEETPDQYLSYQNSGHEGEDEEDCEDPAAGGVGRPLVQHHLVRLQRGEGGVLFKGSILPVLASERK